MTFPPFFRRGLARGLAGALLLATLAIGADARGTSSVWVMKGAKNTVYLAGSVHALPREQSELPPQLERAYAAARSVVMEVDLDDMDPLEAVQFVTSRGTLPEGETLASVVGAAGYAKVSKLAGTLDVPEMVIARLEPWAAAMVLTQFALMKTGYDPQLGIDMQLAGRARNDGKPVDGLETVIDQLGIFDDRSVDEQKQFLAALEKCLKGLPARTAQAFLMREHLGLETDEICKELSVTATHCWVLLYRARMALRQCLEQGWFRATGAKGG